MSILKIKNAQNEWVQLPVLKGPKGDAYNLTVQDKEDIAELVGGPFVKDVQINGTSVISNGVANIPPASTSFGLVKITPTYGMTTQNGFLVINQCTDAMLKDPDSASTSKLRPITPDLEDKAAFYGLARASGDITQSQSLNAIGVYTPEAKGAIQSMLGIDSLIASTETNPFSEAHIVSDLFIINGTLYKAKTAIAVGDVLDDGVNVESVNVNDVAIKDVQINGISVVTDGVAEIPIAGSNILGTIMVANNTHGLALNNYGRLMISEASSESIKIGNNTYNPITPSKQHESTFYGLAKASGDSTQSASSNTVGTYTDEAKASIQTMLGVPSVDDIPDVPVEDVQIDGTSILSDGVANIPMASKNTLGAVALNSGKNGIQYVDGNYNIGVSLATSANIKQGAATNVLLAPKNQHEAVFFGLSKVAGVDLINDTVTTGQYTPEAKGAIQSMLGVDALIAPIETNPFTNAHTIGDLFIINGTLYKAKTAIAVNDVLNEGVNADNININSVLSDYVKNTNYCTDLTTGVARTNSSFGVTATNTGNLRISAAASGHIKAGTDSYKPIPPVRQHEAVFYGLTKAAGVDMASSSNTVGTYTEEAKSAISNMLGGSVSISGTTPTIIAKSGIRYVCGEVESLEFTPPAAGICDVIFTSGTTPTVLVVPSTIKWANNFDPSSLDINTTYELNIMDGLGVACKWT